MKLFRLIRFVWGHPLNKRAPWKALGRMLRWQIASRLLPEAIFGVPFINGTKLFMHRGMSGATGNWYCGLHEVDDMGFVLHLLRPGDLFVDVGANIGSYSVLAAGSIGAHVVAVEPIPSTCEHLNLNLKLNRLESQVEVHCLGLSNSTGILRFTTTLDTVNHVLANGEEGNFEELSVTTLDNLLEGRNPTLLKIDVEGHELAVLEGGKNTLSERGLLAVIMETNGSGARYGVNDTQLIELMEEYGFTCWDYCATSRTLTSKAIFSGDKGKNTIFLRNQSEAENRIKTAPKIQLINGWL